MLLEQFGLLDANDPTPLPASKRYASQVQRQEGVAVGSSQKQERVRLQY